MALISMIVAMDKNGLIGDGNQLPWKIKEDMQWFKRKTMGKAVLMGRKTYESIGKQLPGRRNLVITRKRGYVSTEKHVKVYNSIYDAIAENVDVDEIVIIGGREIYEKTLSIVRELYITRVDGSFKGDVYFPEINYNEWATTQTIDFPGTKHVLQVMKRIL